jgi:hypothetical protein
MTRAISSPSRSTTWFFTIMLVTGSLRRDV